MQALLRNSLSRLCKRVENELHLLFGGTPSTQRFGDEADEGTSENIALADHIHGMPDEPEDPLDQFDDFVFLYSDMIYNVSAANFPDVKTQAVGAGSGVVIGGRDGIGEKFAFGSIDVSTASGSATAFAAAVFTDNQNTNFLTTNQDLYAQRMRRFETRLRVVENTTDLVNLRSAVGSIRTSADGVLSGITDGIYFFLETDAAGVGTWHVACTTGSSTTDIDTGISPRLDGTDTLFDKFMITLEFKEDSLTEREAKFFLNDVLVGTIDTNLPTSSSSNFVSGWGHFLQNKTAASRTFIMDYLLLKADRIAS